MKEEKNTYRVGVVLIVSLAANLFLAGLMLGPWMMKPDKGFERMHEGMPFPPPPAFGPEGRQGPPLDAMFPFTPFMMNLSPDEAKMLRDIVEKERNGLGDREDKRHAAFVTLSGVLAQEKPDEKELEAALEGIETVGRDMHGEMRTIMTRITLEMSWEARKKMAEGIRERRR